jgi:peptidoglycan/LPS O-acetylase OafA/YrhL
VFKTSARANQATLATPSTITDTNITGAAHFQFLDALRGLASAWVVLFHLTVSSTLPAVTGGVPGFLWATIFGRGGLGVAVFFVLSGFVICHSLRRGLGSGPELGTYLLRRAIRLTPPYWAAIGVAVAVHGLAAAVNHESFAPGGAPLSVGRVLSHLFYLEGLVGHEYLNDVFWTLTVEMQFYIILGVFLMGVTVLGRGRPRTFTVSVWGAAALTLAGVRFDGDPQTTFVPLFYAFFLGAIVYWAWTARIGYGIVAVYLGVLGLLFVERPDAFLATTILTGGLMLAAAATNDGLARWLSAPPFQFLGRISYSLYLTHVPVQGAVLLAVVNVAGTGPTAVVLAAVLSTVASLVAALVFWRAIERPAMRWSSSLKKPNPVDTR